MIAVGSDVKIYLVTELAPELGSKQNPREVNQWVWGGVWGGGKWVAFLQYSLVRVCVEYAPVTQSREHLAYHISGGILSCIQDWRLVVPPPRRPGMLHPKNGRG